MTFQIHALPYAPFAPVFDLPETQLARHRAKRLRAVAADGVPCRVSLTEAVDGETVVLVNYQHLDAGSPYDAHHAVYVRKDAQQAQLAPGEIPDMITKRLMSVRAFDADHMMVAAAVVEGADLAPHMDTLFKEGAVMEAHLHIAGPGCFATRVTRAEDP